jgi:hypothetical protein
MGIGSEATSPYCLNLATLFKWKGSRNRASAVLSILKVTYDETDGAHDDEANSYGLTDLDELPSIGWTGVSLVAHWTCDARGEV